MENSFLPALAFVDSLRRQTSPESFLVSVLLHSSPVLPFLFSEEALLSHTYEARHSPSLCTGGRGGQSLRATLGGEAITVTLIRVPLIGVTPWVRGELESWSGDGAVRGGTHKPTLAMLALLINAQLQGPSKGITKYEGVSVAREESSGRKRPGHCGVTRSQREMQAVVRG